MTRKILIVDDSPIIRKMLRRIFDTEVDYDVCAEGTNGEEAIALAVKHQPDLIVLDMAMPVLNGIAASRELKKILPSIPIILFTQHASLSEILFPTEQTVDRIVSKSDVGALIENIRALAPA
jgi:DNA-binding NarL/FixJ family response regulator